MPVALATDTVSITLMELVANATMLLIALGFAIAFPFAFLANRWLLARGKGHALVHQYHQH